MRKKSKFIIILEIVCLFLVLFFSFKENHENYTVNKFYYENYNGQKVYTEELNTKFLQEKASSDLILRSDELLVKPAIYTVNVYFETNMPVTKLHVKEKEEKYNGILSDELFLYPNDNVDTYKIYSNRASEAYIEISIPTVTENITTPYYFRVDNIELKYSYLTIPYRMLKFIGIFMLFDAAVYFIYLMKRNSQKKDSYIIIGGGILVAILCLPLMIKGMPGGHDLDFHLRRIQGLSYGILDGILPVKIQPNWFHGYGYAVSVFYGDIFLYVPAILHILGMPLVTAYKIYVLIINGMTLFIASYCFTKITRERWIGLTCAILYTFSLYRLTDVYTRAAVGEYTAMMFLPFLALGWHLALSEEVDDKRYRYNYLYLVVGYTGIIQTHIISCIMVGIFSAVLCMIMWKKVIRKQTLQLLIKAVIMTVGLNIFFLLPFIDMARSSNINAYTLEDVSPNIQNKGIYFLQLFSNHYNTIGASNSDVMYSEMPLTMGKSALVVFILYFIIRFSRCKNLEENSKKIDICMGLAVLSIGMATVYFPYDSLYQFFSNNIPIIGKTLVRIQFPWRYLELASIFVAVLACYSLKLYQQKLSKEKYKILLIGIIGIVLVEAINYQEEYLNQAEPVIVYNYQDTYGSDSMYAPVGTAIGSYKKDICGYSESIEIVKFQKASTSGRAVISCKNNSENSAIIEVPLMYYKGYRAYDIETKNELKIGAGNNDVLQVQIPGNYEGTFEVHYVERIRWRLAEICSMIVFAYLLLEWKRKEKIKNEEQDRILF